MKKLASFKMLGLILGLFIEPAAFADKPIIGYGSSNTILSAKTQEIFYLGFELGMSLTLKNRIARNLIAVEHAWNGSPLGAQKSAEKLIQKGVIAIAGYPLGYDALLASRVSKKQGIMGIFASGRHSALGSLGPLVVSTVPSMSYDISLFMKFIRSKYPRKRGLVISNSFDLFSKNQEDLIQQTLNQSKDNLLNLAVMHLNKELQFSQSDLQNIKDSKFDYVFLTLYPDMSVHVLNQLGSLGIDIPMIANASWTTDDFELIRRLLVWHKSPVYSLPVWISGSKHARQFERESRKRYGREPSAEAAYGYDLGVIVGNTLNRIKGPLTPQSFINAFYQLPCFYGPTSGKVCFSAQGGHARRKLNLVRFTQENGFVPTSEMRELIK